MPVEYRNMRPADEDAILDLWLETWKGAERERARAGIRADPNLEQHTFIAVGDAGAFLRPPITGCTRYATPGECLGR